MSPQQKAVFLDGVGGKFTLGTTEVYKPGPGELLIKVKSVALNPADWKIQKYEVGLKDFPIILGLDAAGDIEEIGEGVVGFSKGDRVIFSGEIMNNRTDGFQQYAVSPAFRVAKIPTQISYDQAATLSTGLFTAWIGLYNKLPHGFELGPGPNDASAAGKYANTPIVILGGASSVGQFTIQLAKFSQFSPIITTASKKHESLLKSLGATHLIDRFIPLSSLPTEVSKITSKPITLVYDTISVQETQQAGYDLLADNGKIAIVNPPQIKEAEGSGKTVISVYVSVAAPQNAEIIRVGYSSITSLLESGVVVPNKPEVIPGGLSGITEGLRRLENNEVSGVKLVVHPQETV